MRRAMHQRNQITRIYILIFAVSAIVIAACCIGFGFISNASSKTDPDTGRVKRYTSVYIEEGDTPAALQRRVMEQAEWVLLPQAAELLANQIVQEKEQA